MLDINYTYAGWTIPDNTNISYSYPASTLTPKPTTDPTIEPTSYPTDIPTMEPTSDPTLDPTSNPSTIPTSNPSMDPTSDPSKAPTPDPSMDPTSNLSSAPTVTPREWALLVGDTNYNSTKARCESYGTSLATITNLEEHNRAYQYCQDNDPDKKGNCWIGYSRSDSSSPWIWEVKVYQHILIGHLENQVMRYVQTFGRSKTDYVIY